MNERLQKKCVIAATGFHLLLIVILLVGPAFFSPDNKQAVQEIDFIPATLIERELAGGGNPTAGQPAVTSRPPTPAPPTPRDTTTAPPEPQKPKDVVPPTKPDNNDPVESTPKKPAHTVKVNLNQVKRPQTNKTTKANDTNSTADDERANAAKAIANAANNIRQGISGTTSIEMRGPGGGGPTYASYNMEVQRIYKQRYDLALSSAGNIAEEQTSVEASITIARDGTVISAKITSPSKNSALNKLVQRVLDSVTTLRPFPEESKDAERTLDIIFDLKPKQGLG